METTYFPNHLPPMPGSNVYPWHLPTNLQSGSLYTQTGFIGPTKMQNYMASSYAGPQYPSSSPIPEVSGYLYSEGKARDNYKGKLLSYMLENKGIDINNQVPFSAVTDGAGYTTHGVVKINNIPFTVSAQEIIRFISRYSLQPPLKKNHEGYPIHIIMEKPTGKTMDCFVEFATLSAASDCVHRFEYTANPGRGTKLGTRNVSLDLSNQAELMAAVFPRARLVEFDTATGQPAVIREYRKREASGWSEGFRGYFTLEEIYGLTRFAECPSRSPFVLKCHQRVYECMISTLYKFPWAATHTYTVAARNTLFESAYKQLTILSQKVGSPIDQSPESSLVMHNYEGYNHHTGNRQVYDPTDMQMNSREVGLSQSLLFDLLFAAVNVPAFNLLQKMALCEAAGSYGRGVSLSTFSESWPFQTFIPTKDVSDPIIKFWLELFDTGFDIMSYEARQTTFERYLIFARNKVGFPVAEWTRIGTELPFKDAIRVEEAVMMQYVACGRKAWAHERQIDVSRWEPKSLRDLMDEIYLEKHNSCHSEIVESAKMSHADEGVSPRSSSVWNIVDVARSKQPIGADFGAVGDPSPKKHHGPGKFNTATATNSVPALMKLNSSADLDNRTERSQTGENIAATQNMPSSRALISNTSTQFGNPRGDSHHTEPSTSFRNPFAQDSSNCGGQSNNSTYILPTSVMTSSIADHYPWEVARTSLPSDLSRSSGLTVNSRSSGASSFIRDSSSEKPVSVNDLGQAFQKLSSSCNIEGLPTCNDENQPKGSGAMSNSLGSKDLLHENSAFGDDDPFLMDQPHRATLLSTSMGNHNGTAPDHLSCLDTRANSNSRMTLSSQKLKPRDTHVNVEKLRAHSVAYSTVRNVTGYGSKQQRDNKGRLSASELWGEIAH